LTSAFIALLFVENENEKANRLLGNWQSALMLSCQGADIKGKLVPQNGLLSKPPHANIQALLT
jgi:hypothetical protein